MSKSKEKIRKIDEEIEKKKQEELAKRQLEDARDIAMKGFSRYGIRDFFENTIVRALILSVIVFVGLFFGTSLFLYYTRNFELTTIIGLAFIGEALPGVPNYIWWIVGVSVVIVVIILLSRREKVKK